MTRRTRQARVGNLAEIPIIGRAGLRHRDERVRLLSVGPDRSRYRSIFASATRRERIANFDAY